MQLGELNRVLRASQLFIIRNDDDFPQIVPLVSHSDDRLPAPGAWIDTLVDIRSGHTRPVVVPDTSALSPNRILQRANIAAFMLAPIVLKDERTFGFLCAADEVPREYTSGEVELIEWAANLIAYLVDVDQSSIVDPLTGALNRSFLQRLKSGAQRDFGSTFALVFIDIDNFKTINDRFGHAVGDEVLKIVVHRLKRRVRVDDAVVRYGGDEFVVLLNGISDRKQVVAATARRLLEAVEREYSIENQSIRVAASLGISISPRDAVDIDDLIQAADSVMYEQKASGGNGFRIAEPECDGFLSAVVHETRA